MNETQEITPEQQDVPIDAASVDDRARHSYFRQFWDSYKGHVRGLLTGVAIGSLLGLGIGLAVAAFIPELAGFGTIATLMGIGSLIGGEAYGSLGAAAASRASGLAEKHARILDPMYKGNTLGALNDKLMADGRGHHYEFPRTRDKGKWFSWKSGLLGALVGALTGSLAAGPIGAISLLSGVLGPMSLALGSLAVPVTFALIGLTFGVERSIFKTIFNKTDGIIRGRHYDDSNVYDPGRAQFAGLENSQELAQHRLERQNHILSLEKQYNEKIFWGGGSGLFRGLAGGVITGALIGLGVGALAFGIAYVPAVFSFLAGSAPTLSAAAWGVTHSMTYALASATGLTTGATAGTVLQTLMVAFGGVGAVLGMQTFSQAGVEAGAESTARAIDAEFEQNRILRAKGIEPARAKPVNDNWISPKKAILGGVVGALAGIPLSGVIAPILGLATVSIGASMLMSGLFGATFGLGNKPWHAISHAATYLYDKSYFSRNDLKAQPLQQAAAQTPSMPAAEPITPEEMASLEARLAAGNGKNFTQTFTQQLQTPSTPSAIGV